MKQPLFVRFTCCLAGGWFTLGVSPGLAADRHWDGDLNSFWATANNWSNNVAPGPGDNLFFPSGQLLPSITTNNFAPGTAFGRITIAAAAFQAYVLGGNGVLLQDGLVYTGNSSATAPLIACDLTLGANQTFSASRGINLAGRVDLNGRTLTVSPSISGNMFFSGVLTDSTGTGQLNKTNTGLMVISPTAQVSGMTMTVQSGTLRVDGLVTNAPVSIRAPLASPVGTAVLAGSGFVQTAVVSDTISPGNNSPGILRMGYLGLAGGASCGTFCTLPAGTFVAELNGTIAGSQYDQLVVDDYVLHGPSDLISTFTPAKLDVRMGYPAQVGDSFQIVSLNPASPYVPMGGYFLGWLPLFARDLTNGCTLGVTYSNGVALTVLRIPTSDFQFWKGSTNTNRNWSDTNNWGQGVVPAAGGRVRFTPFQYREPIFSGIDTYHFYFTNTPPQTNDLVGLTLASVFLSDTNYVFHGNGLTVTEGITNRVSSGTNACHLDLGVAGSLALVVDAGGTLVLGGAFGGGGAIHQEGSGELRYTGTTQNAFLGHYTLSQGTLRVDGVLNDPDLTLNGGLLCGTGYVGNVTLNTGTVNPGSSTGILRVLGTLNLSAGATCQFELNGVLAGSSYDQLQVNGTVALNGATLEALPGFAAPVGSVFLLVANDGSDPIVGTFAGLPQGAVFQAGGQHFSISYQAGSSGNDIVLTRVNPPPPPAQISQVGLSSPGTIQIQGFGGSNVSYTVLANTNLATTNWQSLGLAPADALGQFFFQDTNAGVFPQRFYRLRWP
jgi:hypothetical protein